jgi:hypothetical protein
VSVILYAFLSQKESSVAAELAMVNIAGTTFSQLMGLGSRIQRSSVLEEACLQQGIFQEEQR